MIHSAARVSFDSPLDVAVEVNLLGPLRVLAAVADVDPPPHVITVSTAYVAGSRRGLAPEAPLSKTPFSPELDWRAEVDVARRARADTDAESRRPELLARFAKEARAELGAAGPPLLATKAEKLREEWMADHLVEAGRSRAKSLGWPDAYAYTKALAERAVSQEKGDVPVTVVRPSVIESALSEPSPGWIRGFRMAEPVIISYGRGLLKEFPGIPEGVVDVIPVDMVVATILAVAAKGPEPGDSPVYHVATGNRNPLHYRRLVDLVREYFGEHPLYDSSGQPIVVPPWQFTARGRALKQLERGVKALDTAEKVVASLPIRGKRAEVTARLEERRNEGERALEYVRLYGAYAETEAIFDDKRLVELWNSLDDADHATFGFDTTVIDWQRYVQEIHLPSVVRQARVPHHGGHQGGAVALRPGQAGHPLPRPAHGRLRPREHPHRLQRGGAATRGWPPAGCPTRTGSASCSGCWARGPGCSPSTSATGATSSATSTAATRTPAPTSSATTPRRCSATCCSTSRSPPGSAGCGSTAAWATARC